MHYIRLLRAPKLTFQEGKKNPWSLNLVLTVTTDLGDSFLAHDEPVKIKVALGWENPRSAKQKPAPMTLAGEKTLQWTSGMRVLKADFPAQHLKPERNLPSGETPLRVYIAAGSGLSAETAADVAMTGFNGEEGKIVPLWANVDVPTQGYKAYGDSPGAPTTCFRRLRLGSEHHPYIVVEEDIGESIARHPLGMRTLKSLLFGNKPVNILELGCGVGIFGLGLARMLGRETISRKGRLVITDLSEAEERVLSNIELSRSNHTEPQFEELDWDEGRDGSFGPLVEDTHWDLIVLSDCTYNADALPSLIDTWSAIHKQNNAMAEDRPVVTRVLVAMKVRHADEDRLWELVKNDGWAVTEKAAMPLPMLGGEPQEIFLYLFENRRRMLPDGYV
uniref:Upf0665 family protein c n=1 Tax=Colletotrichum fructicola (strain Nara gc5) TaxID=1213859 RepID=L2G0S9_COLFN